MDSSHLLIVDDEPNIRQILKRSLKDKTYIVDTAANGAEALARLTTAAYDLLLLDLHMEPIHGLEVLSFARQQDPDLVVIIFTAYCSVESAVEALRLDVFDYLAKPIRLDIIRQRIQEGLQYRREALLQRQLLAQIENLRQTLNGMSPQPEGSAPAPCNRRFVSSGQLIIDCDRRQVRLNGELLDLTTTEFDFLLCLVNSAPEPLSPRQLINRALGYASDDVEARGIAKWHIHNLRRKIEPDPSHPYFIKTVRHKGYMWSGEPAG